MSAMYPVCTRRIPLPRLFRGLDLRLQPRDLFGQRLDRDPLLQRHRVEVVDGAVLMRDVRFKVVEPLRDIRSVAHSSP